MKSKKNPRTEQEILSRATTRLLKGIKIQALRRGKPISAQKLKNSGYPQHIIAQVATKA